MVQQRCLSDSGLAPEHQRAACARARGLDHGVEQGTLRAPPAQARWSLEGDAHVVSGGAGGAASGSLSSNCSRAPSSSLLPGSSSRQRDAGGVVPWRSWLASRFSQVRNDCPGKEGRLPVASFQLRVPRRARSAPGRALGLRFEAGACVLGRLLTGVPGAATQRSAEKAPRRRVMLELARPAQRP